MALSKETKEFSSKHLNYFRVCHLTATIIPEYLRIIFKIEWDSRYGTTHGVWADTAENGNDFYSMTTPREQRLKKKEIDEIKNGNSQEWDCTCLFYSILYSDCIGNKGLDPVVKRSVDTLREFRNIYFAHSKDGTIADADFQASIKDVIVAIEDLKLDATKIENIRNQTEFPTKDLHDIQSQLEAERNKNKDPRPFCILPPVPSHETIWREKKTTEIYNEIKRQKDINKEKVTVTYISGNPGCGKTEIARQIGEKYFYDMSNDVATPFVMTLDASSISTLLSSYVEFASFLKCNDPALSQITTSQKSDEEKIILLRKEFINSAMATFPCTWLIIVDNVDNLKLISKFIPHAGQIGRGHVLITTEELEESQSIPPPTPFSLHFSLSDGMESDEAVKSLLIISECEFENDHIGIEVAKALDFQPLALACAAMWMQDTKITNKAITWTMLLQKLRDGNQAIMERVYERKSTAYSKTMTTAVKMALEKKIVENDVCKYAFQLFSVTAPERIPLENVVNYVIQYLPTEGKDSIASEIKSSSLIVCFEENSELMVRVHQIVHFMAVEINRNEIRDLAFWLKVLKVFALQNDCRRPTSDDGSTHILLLHVSHIFNHVLQFFKKNEVYTFQERCMHFLKHLSTSCLIEQYNELLEYLLIITQIDCQMRNSPIFKNLSLRDIILIDLCMTSYNLALRLRVHGQYTLALTLLRNVIPIACWLHPTFVAYTLSYAAVFIKDLGQCQQAKKISMSIIEKVDGFEYITYASSILNNHGVILLDLGEYTDAKEMFQRALDYKDRKNVALPYIMTLFGISTHYLVQNMLETTTEMNLGLALVKLGKYSQALTISDNILAVHQRKGHDDPSMAKTLRIRALAFQGLGKYVQAKNELANAITIQESVHEDNNPGFARMLRNLASILQDLGQYLQAQDHLEKAIAIEESTCCEDERKLASTLCVLGSVLRDLGSNDEAKIHLERALDIQESRLDKEHPRIATTLCVFSTVLQRLGDYSQARTNLERALSIQRKSLGCNHPSVANSLTVFASVLQDQGKYDHAKKILKKAMNIQETVLGSNHPRLAVTLFTYASVLKDLGEIDQAKVFLKKAASIQEKALDKEHPHLERTLSLLAYLDQE